VDKFYCTAQLKLLSDYILIQIYLIIVRIGTASDFLVFFSTVLFMFLNKRISKFRSAPALLSQESSENTPPSIKAQKVARCRFKQIPQNTKFVIDDPMYPLIGVSPSIFYYSCFKTFPKATNLIFFIGHSLKRLPIWAQHGYIII
jgi:hypothetical protein